MLRMTCTGLALIAATAMVGCNSSLNSMGSSTGYTGGEGIRFDANGNRIYDPSVANTNGSGTYRSGSSQGSYNGTPGMGNNYNGGTPNNGQNNNGNWNNDRSGSNSNWNNTDRNSNNNGNWNNDRSGSANSTSNSNWNNNNDLSGGNWSDHWSDANMSSVNDSDLPSGVRSTLNREAGNGSVSEYRKGTWDGRTAYCGKVNRNGTMYKIVTDADGNILASKQAN